MKVDLIFSDIDGTLLNNDRDISKKTKATLERLNHIPLVLISSRMPKAMRHLQKDLNILKQPIIAYNGGLIIEKDKVISSTEIDLAITKNIVQLNNKKVHLSLYQFDEWFVPADDFWTKREINNTKAKACIQDYAKSLAFLNASGKGCHKIMCMGEEKDIERLYNQILEKFPTQLHLYRSKPTYIEIAPKQISKLSAIEILLKKRYNEIKLSHCIAFGDNYNDIEMINGVGVGVAVDNAKPELKAVANHVTTAAKDDGVAEFLIKNLL